MTPEQRKLAGIGDYKRAFSFEGVKTVSKKDIEDALLYAQTLTRAREPILLNEQFDEAPQRFINCLTPDSYVRPHMHVVPNQWELMSWLSGEIIVLIFDNFGKITNRMLMNEKEINVIEIPPFIYHTFVPLQNCSYLEVRNCKYQPNVDRVYSVWSPEENTFEAKIYQKRFFNAQVGDILREKNS